MVSDELPSPLIFLTSPLQRLLYVKYVARLIILPVSVIIL
jgi:hypothetical protein